jgi:GWxTD domain-containing protein
MRFTRSQLFLTAILAGSLAAPYLRAQDSKPAADAKKDDAAAQGQQQDPLKRPLSDKQRKENDKAFRKEVDVTYRKWLDQDVKYIITGEELEAFKRLSNNEERDNFIEQFWLRRDPTPDTVENEYKEEHYRRIAYANEHYAAGVAGWRTDRGRIYVVYGPPDETESHASGGMYNRDISEGGGSTSTYPFERWRYRYIEGIGNEIILEFVDKCMCNQYALTMDPSEKDALLNTPGAGLTMAEEQGRASKTDRILGGSRGYDPFGNNQSKALSNLELMAKINSAPPIKFKDLQEKVDSKIRYNLMPFDVRADFVRVTGETVLVPVTIQVKNRDITFLNKEGVQRGVINIFGRITTITGRVAQTFEDTVKVDVPESLFQQTVANNSVYWKAVPLTTGMYKMDIVVKDVNGDRVGVWTKSIRVPGYSEDKLATSSLILADLMEKVPSRNVGAGNFVIGDTKVRPRVDASDGKPAAFKKGQRLNLWMQVYNLGIDEKTKKSSATIEYDIVNAQTNKSVVHAQESSDQFDNPGEQVTLQKSLALNLDPGLYRVTVKVDDNVSKQTISPTARFAVE